MRTLFTPIAGLFWLAPMLPAQEAPRAEVSASYSYLREGNIDGTNANGGSFSVAGNFNRWFGIAGDFGAYHSSPFGQNLNAYTFLAGPRFSLRSDNRVTPFAQVPVGGAHLAAGYGGASGSTSGFAYSAGGGVDLGLTKRLALRPQFDYIGIRASGNTLNSYRASFGVVFRFGN
ncbi:MAG TPA: outer membrane beta-barrel protein [Candidatus Limnocylindrales bacterium]|nr:outer membrane beta-barrel protein [Candidatus Limnocylindrales bacterium]